MTLLGRRNFFKEESNETEEKFRIPALLQNKPDAISMKRALILSVILHPVTVGLVSLILFILAILGVTFTMFDKPQPKMNDIEFVLVQNEAKPTAKTNLRADKNSRAGGKHDPKRKISEPSPAPSKSAAPSSAKAPVKKVKKQQPAPQPQKVQSKKQPKLTDFMPKQVTKKPVQQAPAKTVSKPVEKPQGVPNPPVPNMPRPTLKPTAPRPTANPSSSVHIPVPKMSNSAFGPTGGPVTGSPKGLAGVSGGSGGSSYGKGSAPSPNFAPTGGSGKGRYSQGGSGYGNAGNPGPGNPHGAPGVNAMRDPDFGPYMRELQRRIKMNWDPPKGNESKRVVLIFRISRSGRLLSIKTLKSSGVAAADRAAINAVQLTAPFKPLPPEYKKESVDVQFTFDYNVFGPQY